MYFNLDILCQGTKYICYYTSKIDESAFFLQMNLVLYLYTIIIVKEVLL